MNRAYCSAKETSIFAPIVTNLSTGQLLAGFVAIAGFRIAFLDRCGRPLQRLGMIGCKARRLSDGTVSSIHAGDGIFRVQQSSVRTTVFSKEILLLLI